MLEEKIRANRRKILTGRAVFLLYAVAYSCVIFIPLSYVFVRAAGTLGWVAILISLTLWTTILGLTVYYNADIVCRVVGAEPLEEGRFSRLASAAEDIALASGQEVPRLMLIEDHAVNAFSMVSVRKRHGMVFCTEGLAQDLHPDEARAVMAHEMAHLKNGDTELGSLVLPFNACASLLIKPASKLFISFVKPARAVIIMIIILFLVLPVLFFLGYAAWSVISSETFIVILLGLLLPLISVYLLGTLVSVYWSFTLGKREYLADETAVEWTNYPEGMIDALHKAAEHNTSSSRAFLDDACFAPPGG